MVVVRTTSGSAARAAATSCFQFAPQRTFARLVRVDCVGIVFSRGAVLVRQCHRRLSGAGAVSGGVLPAVALRPRFGERPRGIAGQVSLVGCHNLVVHVVRAFFEAACAAISIGRQTVAQTEGRKTATYCGVAWHLDIGGG
eukprot:SAG22_NODE_9089_length_610_cov_1.285714_2_plen_140_part_01